MANEVVLTFDYEIPPSAEDLGDLLSALARDYREASGGRTLVVTDVQSGSIIFQITDAVLAAAPYVGATVGVAVTTMADYNEACAIRDLSPKASATLTRRCLQGMIRDFCGINKRRLIDEIDQLRTQVEEGRAPPGVQPDAVEAIDHVRSVGNIGAHMEADINVIVDVDPDEAQTLIELIELLFVEWYVARNDRQSRLSRLKDIAIDKKNQKNSQGDAEPQPS